MPYNRLGSGAPSQTTCAPARKSPRYADKRGPFLFGISEPTNRLLRFHATLARVLLVICPVSRYAHSWCNTTSRQRNSLYPVPGLVRGAGTFSFYALIFIRSNAKLQTVICKVAKSVVEIGAHSMTRRRTSNIGHLAQSRLDTHIFLRGHEKKVDLVIDTGSIGCSTTTKH